MLDDDGQRFYEEVQQYQREEQQTMIVKNSGGDFEQITAGTKFARCIRLIDIGTQEGEFNGEKNFRRQVIIGFETPDELITKGDSSGKPFIVSKFYTMSLHEKANLRHDLVSWRGREFTKEEEEGFNMANVLDKPCMLSIIINEKKRAVIASISAIPKGSVVGPRVNPLIFFSLDEYDDKVFQSLGQKMQEMIAKSPEYKALKSPQSKNSVTADFDDDVPFN